MKNIIIKRLLGLICVIGLLAGCMWLASLRFTTVPPSQDSTSTAPSYNPAVGKVTVFTCDRDLYTGFQLLAQAYTQQTGIQVTVLTAGVGDCQAELDKHLQGENAPTLFCLHSQQTLENRADTLLDLSGSPILDALCSEDFAMQVNGKPLAVTAHTQGYGLVYNAALLAKTGFTRSDITDFSQLEMVSQFITGQSMAYAAFAAPDFSDPSHQGTASLLADAAGDADNLRKLWDLYIQNLSTATKGLAAFLESGSVFCLGGTWAYDAYAALGSSNLDIMPVFTPAGGSLGYTVELCWGINSQAATLDVQRTVEFLTWMATAQGDDPAPVDQLGLFTPFRDAARYDNPLEKKLREYIGTEPARVSWLCCQSLNEAALADLGKALAAYQADPTDENWKPVKDILS